MKSDAFISDGNSILAFLATLHVAEAQTLYVMLAADGTIHRMGNGSELNENQDLFMGKCSTSLVTGLRTQIKNCLFQWLGRFSDPNPQGKRCRLTIGLQMDDGSELLSQWEYGTQSQGPPQEITDLVSAAINVTQPWYEEQKMVARKV